MKISPELLDTFLQLGEIRKFTRKFTLLREGEVSRHAYFVESGSIRLWYNNDGADISVKFFLPGELCASMDSFYHEAPSKYELETITPCVLRVATKPEILQKMAEMPGFDDYISSVMVHCMADYQDLFVGRIGKPPADRYRALLKDDPEILNIVPLHYIASYLGITPVSLSRIRRKTQLS